MIASAAEEAEDPGDGPADRALGAAADELEGRDRGRSRRRRCDWYQTRPRIESRPPSVTMKDGTPM